MLETTDTQDRDSLLFFAGALQNPLTYARILHKPNVDVIGRRAMAAAREWGAYGCQSVELPHTYAAALMATDVHNAPPDEKLPWPAFEIQIPTGLLKSDHGELINVIVCELPRDVSFDPAGPMHDARYMLTYNDQISCGNICFRSMEELLTNKSMFGRGTFIPTELNDTYDSTREQRLWQMLTRLVAGVIFAINMARVDKPEAFPQKPTRVKNGTIRGNSHRLGHTLRIDCRQAIHDYVEGVRRNELNVSTWVRGHWRNQAHGPKWTLHRRVWVLPFMRGEGELLQRPTKLKEPV